MKYKILWIDDEHEDFVDFKALAKDSGLEMYGFKSLNAGIDELEKNYNFYDGVLLDAKILKNEDDAAGTEDIKYIHKAKDRINRLSSKKHFEIFVLTGQAKAFDDNTFNEVYKNVYVKGSRKDNERLLTDLLEAAKSQEDTQLKQRHPELISIITEDKYYLKDEFDRVFNLLKITTQENSLNSTESLNEIRKVIEVIFDRLKSIKLIPEEILNNHGWISGCSRFLSNIHPEYVYDDKKFDVPKVISETLHSLLKVVQDGSHSTGNLKVVQHINSYNSDYIIKASIFKLFEILMWYKKTIDNYPNQEENVTFWREKEQITTSIIGVIKQDEYRNYYIGDYLFNYNDANSANILNKKIEIKKYQENSNERNYHLYSKYVTKFVVLEN